MQARRDENVRITTTIKSLGYEHLTSCLKKNTLIKMSADNTFTNESASSRENYLSNEAHIHTALTPVKPDSI